METKNRALIDCLARIYVDVTETQALLLRWGIDLHQIARSDQAITYWTNIIIHLKKTTGCLQRFLLALRNHETAGKNELFRKLTEDLTEMQDEVLVNKDEPMLPAAFMKKGAECGRAVARIVTPFGTATGSLLKDNWFLTNYHAVSSIEIAKALRLQFIYEEGAAYRSAHLDPGDTVMDGRFYIDPRFDWAMIKAAGDLNGEFGWLHISESKISVGENVNIIQHPKGNFKKVAIRENKVMYADDDKIQYLTNTMKGSSGSPVFNDQWEVVALHRKGGWLEDPVDGEAYYRNEGVNISRVMREWEQRRR